MSVFVSLFVLCCVVLLLLLCMPSGLRRVIFMLRACLVQKQHQHTHKHHHVIFLKAPTFVLQAPPALPTLSTLVSISIRVLLASDALRVMTLVCLSVFVREGGEGAVLEWCTSRVFSSVSPCAYKRGQVEGCSGGCGVGYGCG